MRQASHMPDDEPRGPATAAAVMAGALLGLALFASGVLRTLLVDSRASLGDALVVGLAAGAIAFVVTVSAVMVGRRNRAG